jgi:hypothetical protein
MNEEHFEINDHNIQNTKYWIQLLRIADEQEQLYRLQRGEKITIKIILSESK